MRHRGILEAVTSTALSFRAHDLDRYPTNTKPNISRFLAGIQTIAHRTIAHRTIAHRDHRSSGPSLIGQLLRPYARSTIANRKVVFLTLRCRIYLPYPLQTSYYYNYSTILLIISFQFFTCSDVSKLSS